MFRFSNSVPGHPTAGHVVSSSIFSLDLKQYKLKLFHPELLLNVIFWVALCS